MLEYNQDKERFKLRKEFYAAGESVTSLSINKEYNYLVSTSRDGLARVWDLDDFSFKCTLVGHKDNAVYYIYQC